MDGILVKPTTKEVFENYFKEIIIKEIIGSNI